MRADDNGSGGHEWRGGGNATRRSRSDEDGDGRDGGRGVGRVGKAGVDEWNIRGGTEKKKEVEEEDDDEDK